MRFITQQSNFTRGELDPRLFARTDTEIYQKGAKKIRNALVLPQGGITRRPGTKFVAQINGVTNNEVVMTSFEFSSDTGYLLVFINLAILIYFEDVLAATVITPYVAADLIDLRFTQSADTMFIVHGHYQPQQLVRTMPPNVWALTPITFRNLPVYDFNKDYDSVVFQPTGNSGAVTIKSNPGVFSPDFINGIFAGNRGTLRLTNYISETEMSGNTITDFLNTNVIPGNTAFLAQAAWSTAKGWPATVTLYEDRLWFGGSLMLPQTIWASQSGDYFDFDFGSGLDSDAIGVTINTTKSNNIEYILSSRTLSIFTDGATFTAPQTDDRALTSRTISIRQQSENGVSQVSPKEIDNKILYVQSGGKKIRSFIYQFQQAAYDSEDVSILSAHLIKSPVDAAVLKNSPIDDAEYYYAVNSDGTIATFQTIKEQDVQAWSLSNTAGQYIAIASVNADIYVLVTRLINDVSVLYVEKFDINYFLDCSTQLTFTTPTQTITGLSNLEGQTVRVKADGYVLNNQIVTSGTITLEQPVNNVEIGLNINVEVEILPPTLPANPQMNPYVQKRISRFFIYYYESLGIYINDVLVPFLEFGNHVLDQPPEPKTGISEILITSTYQPSETVKITQKDPLPFLLMSVATEVTTNG